METELDYHTTLISNAASLLWMDLGDMSDRVELLKRNGLSTEQITAARHVTPMGT